LYPRQPRFLQKRLEEKKLKKCSVTRNVWLVKHPVVKRRLVNTTIGTATYGKRTLLLC
jgi:hypothetical protein